MRRSKNIAEKKILRMVRQTIADHRMLAAGDAVLIAISGGMDSVAMVQVLHTLAADFSIQLAIAHLNHSLRREDSDRDADFVAEFARRLELPLYIEKRNVRQFQRTAHLSLEEAARAVRYEFLKETAARNGFNKIATGHHGNDNAELVLMNLLRGSGPLGLSGIAPVRDGKIIRPLLELKQSEIVDYITEKKLPFVTDSSNTDLSFRRNRIRHHLIPTLEKSYNPAVIDTLNRLGTIMRSEDQWLENVLDQDYSRCIAVDERDSINIDLERFEGLATAAKRRIIRKAIRSVKNDLRRITLLHVDAVLGLIDNRPGAGYLNLPDGIQITLKAEDLTIKKNTSLYPGRTGKPNEPVVIDYIYTITAPGIISIKETGLSIKLSEIGTDELPDFEDIAPNIAFFDMDSLQFPLVVRNFRPGDRFSPLGISGTQKVKKYFIDHKIPGPQRRKCPLLLSHDKIIWIAGHRMDNCVKVVPATSRIIKAEVLLA
ncbi:MAG: tRNA lysidine(34) synthetase TilS [bacterium]|nr:tRNA lysidine(34) synthetase TilS [bacterium]